MVQDNMMMVVVWVGSEVKAACEYVPVPLYLVLQLL